MLTGQLVRYGPELSALDLHRAIWVGRWAKVPESRDFHPVWRGGSVGYADRHTEGAQWRGSHGPRA